VFVNPARPNPEFDAFVMSILRQIGVGLEIPYEILIKHFTASYSASRAALETAWQFFRRRRTWLARRSLPAGL
jgi:capsid protein